MKVEIYSTVNCPNCQTAIQLSEGNVEELIVLKANEDFQIPEMIKRIGQRVGSFPQIFIDDKYVGGLKEYEEVISELRAKPDLEDIDDLDIDL